MANNVTSNFTEQLARPFLEMAENERVLSKSVNTQFLDGAFGKESGDTVSIRRPTDYKSTRTAGGDITGVRADIVVGKATAVIQDYITVPIEYEAAVQAIKLGNLEELLAPAVTRIVTDLEVSFADFMLKNSSVLSGAYGTSVSTWKHVAESGALMQALGVPPGEWFYGMNPYTQIDLADNQRVMPASESLGASAFKNATINPNYAGMKVMAATTLATVTSAAGADRAGTLTATPTGTYVGAKDTMTQSIPVTGFQANLVIKAGQMIEVAGRNRVNLATRQPIVNAAGAAVLWSGVVKTDVTLGASGEGNIVVTGPAIYEATGAFNTTSSALASGDVITLLGAASTLYQPNLAWHKNAFAIGSVPIPKLHSTDTIATTKDGMQFRVSKYANGDANKNIVRFDFQPAFASLNPYWAIQSFGR